MRVIERLKFEWWAFKEWYFSLGQGESWAKQEEERLKEHIVQDMADRLEIDREELGEIKPPSEQGNNDR